MKERVQIAAVLCLEGRLFYFLLHQVIPILLFLCSPPSLNARPQMGP